MIAKLVAGLLAAVAVSGTGVYFATAKTGGDCCPGSACCVTGSACCEQAAPKTDDCGNPASGCCEAKSCGTAGDECCTPAAPCCEAAACCEKPAPAAKAGCCAGEK